MSEVKQVKVDNWGVYFLQRLKHFFNRTDYCDLTLQFQDNAQLKVHRLVLSACTEYFELLERTCEMYEDCLVMPDDLQADVVVPIVNFMYTGQLEFKMDLLDKLHQTSEIMSMPVLTKLLDSHRPKVHKVVQSYSAPKRVARKIEGTKETIKKITPTEIVTTQTVQPCKKRNFTTAFETTTIYRDKKVYLPLNKNTNREVSLGMRTYREPSPIPLDDQIYAKKAIAGEPRPTRYELPEELDSDNIFENSFCHISYTSQPLMVHPETQKQYSKRPSTSNKLGSAVVMTHRKGTPQQAKQQEALFEEPPSEVAVCETELFPDTFEYVKAESSKNTSILFDQILEQNEEPTKLGIERKTNQPMKTSQSISENLDHAKIISEVLKKYPHLVKSNKNIKLKIFNTPSKSNKKAKLSPVQTLTPQITKPPAQVIKSEKESDYTFETDVIDSKQAAQLIALGAENVHGPWICLICGTPGKAMNFTSYYKFRRHLVEVHHEKPILNLCEYCGQRSTKRNYLLHHMYTKHGVEPPPQYHFPKCNNCNYIALTEALLIKHRASHVENKRYRCNVCPSSFATSSQLLTHIQNTGHKYSSEKKTNLQCIYCQKVFMRENNLCAHLKAYHRSEAVRDGIIDDSDEDAEIEKNSRSTVKSEPKEFEELDIHYQIQKRPDGNIQVITKKTQEPSSGGKQKILNSGYVSQLQPQKAKVVKPLNHQTEYVQEINQIASNDGEIVVIDNNEYIIRDNQLIPRGMQPVTEEYILADQSMPSLTGDSPMEYTNIHNPDIQESVQQPDVLLKNTGDLNQHIPIYVSNEAEYKALMASNQSIIVDNTDSNKMLTVLTAPHASSLETTSIDLDNTQSSDMMIIQDNYPINVSEAVTTDNSNIVVVYSTQVGDQNKQFQLLTTQGLGGAQFVQSSAILTQNYETITTTTPVINAPTVEGKQEIWHNNIQHMINDNEIEITPVTSISNIADTNQSQISNSVQSVSIEKLPHVQINSNNIQPNTISLGETTNECQDVSAEEPNNDEINYNNTEEQVSNTQSADALEIAEAIPLAPEPVDETNNTSNSLENEPNTPQMEVEENELQPVQHLECQGSEETANLQESENTTSGNVNQTLIQPEDIIAPDETLELEKIDAVPEPVLPNISTEQEFVTEDVSEKAQLDTTLEENDTDHVDETQELSHTPNEIPPNAETCEELEESIENIQQEVEKQINYTPSSTSVYEDARTATDPKSSENETEDLNREEVSSQEESDHEENSPEADKPDPVEAQEKISSLLNDWEDSQEDNNSANENVPAESEETAEIVSVAEAESEAEVPTDPVAPSEPVLENDKQDNIKSLVSDWDEDEEENKE